MRPIHSSRERRRKIACALLLMLIVDMGMYTSRALPYLGDSVQLAVFDPRYGIGRGKALVQTPVTLSLLMSTQKPSSLPKQGGITIS